MVDALLEVGAACEVVTVRGEPVGAAVVPDAGTLEAAAAGAVETDCVEEEPANEKENGLAVPVLDNPAAAEEAATPVASAKANEEDDFAAPVLDNAVVAEEGAKPNANEKLGAEDSEVPDAKVDDGLAADCPSEGGATDVMPLGADAGEGVAVVANIGVADKETEVVAEDEEDVANVGGDDEAVLFEREKPVPKAKDGAAEADEEDREEAEEEEEEAENSDGNPGEPGVEKEGNAGVVVLADEEEA